MNALITHKIKDIQNICSELGVNKLYVFGSAATGDFNKDSDIDFLVFFDKDLSIDQYTENYFDLHYRLRELFDREIDIVTERSLSNPYFIKSIEKTKELIYEKDRDNLFLCSLTLTWH